jgi:3-oxoacyl-[acyl-carrier protein] reductase
MSERIFDGRIALVTGGARGIGRAVAVTLARAGARVAINYQRNEVAARKTLEIIQGDGGQALLAQADVADPQAVERMVGHVGSTWGPVDLLVNNAGIAESLPHTELTFPRWKHFFAVNVDGPFLTTWAVKDSMIARKFGRIVNVASLAGLVMKKNMIHYATTKAAVISFTRHCAEAFAPHNVRVNCVAPGLTDTEITAAANTAVVESLIAATPMGRMAQPEEIASVVRFLLSDDSGFVTGQTVSVCGGRV